MKLDTVQLNTATFVRRRRLAQLVRARRGTTGLRDAAAECLVSAATLSRVESEKDPDIETLHRLCVWMKVSPNDVFSWTGNAGWHDTMPTSELLLLQASLLENVSLLNRLIEEAVIEQDTRRG